MASGFRVKCPSCGDVLNAAGPCFCGKCGAEIRTEGPGMLQLYRMGNVMGAGVGFGIYLNGQPFGHLGNRENIRIPLPFGTYTIHMTAGMSRRCQDLTVTLSPETPYLCAKAHLKMGAFVNTVIVEPAAPSEMPPLD